MQEKSKRGRKPVPDEVKKNDWISIPIEESKKEAVLKAGQVLGLSTGAAVFRHLINAGLEANGIEVEL